MLILLKSTCTYWSTMHTLSGSCKICLKHLKKGIPKVNCMLFLNHLDYMHGFGLFWKVTLWGLFLNCQSYWYWVIELWTHWKSKNKNSVYIFFCNKSLQMTIAGSYELENTMGSQNEASNFKFDNNTLENECFTHVYLSLCLGASQKRTLGDSKWPFVTNDT